MANSLLFFWGIWNVLERICFRYSFWLLELNMKNSLELSRLLIRVLEGPVYSLVSTTLCHRILFYSNCHLLVHSCEYAICINSNLYRKPAGGHESMARHEDGIAWVWVKTWFKMENRWIQWHAYVKEQVIKSVNQIKRVKSLQRIITQSLAN